jgi:hypothetical protein
MPMAAIIMPVDLDKINRKNEFLAYKGTSNKNILFLGSCRTSPMMYYLSLLRPELNIFCIYVPFWDSNSNLTFPKEQIEKVLLDTEAIVTESVKNNSILNTSRECAENFFDEFKTEVEEIRLPNYILSMYLYDIVNMELKDDEFVLCENAKKQCNKIFDSSRERLSNSIKKSGFAAVDEFIYENFTKIKMFSTINHPTTIVSMITFKIMAQRLGIKKELLSIDFFKHVSNHHLLSGNSTPVTRFDVDNYGFKFNTTVFENDAIKQKNLFYKPTHEEDFISDDQIKMIMSNDYK